MTDDEKEEKRIGIRHEEGVHALMSSVGVDAAVAGEVERQRWEMERWSMARISSVRMVKPWAT